MIINMKQITLYDIKIDADVIITKYCSKCGIEKPLSEFYPDKRRNYGLKCYCIECSKKNGSTDYYNPNKKAKYNNYKNKAYNHDRDFKLTYEEFKGIALGNCYYCGDTGYHGIDRVDNDKGYIKGNCVCCCGICNRMKFNYTKSDFFNHIKKIYKHTAKL